LTLYIFILFMNILFDVAREAIQNGIPLAIILKLLYFQIPQLLVISLPMSILFGILIGVGRLSGDSEIIALQAAGIPLRRLVRPAAILGLGGTLICFYFVAFVAPQGTYAHHLVNREVYLSRYVNSERIVPKVFHETIPGMLLYYDDLEEETGAFQRVFMYEREPGTELERLTVARRGELSFDAESGRVSLYLQDGITHARHLDADPLEDYSVITFGSYQENREAPAYIKAFSRKLKRNHREMSLTELREEVASAREDTNPVVRRLRLGLALTSWHERFALPAAALAFALLGLPLGIVNRRGGKASGFAVSLGVVLVYWVSYSILRDVAETGRLNAMVALWIPNLAFAVLALLLTMFRRGGQGSARGLPILQRLRNRLHVSGVWRRRPSASEEGDSFMDDSPLGTFPLLIDRYIASHFLRILLFVLLAVYLVFMLVEFRALADSMVENKIGIGVLLRYLASLVPRMTFTILPVACLVATLVGLGLMAKGREDVAVKAAGVSVYRLLVPVLALTGLVCLLGYFLQNEVLPVSNQVSETLRDRIRGRSPRSQDPRHRWVMGRDHRLYHYESTDPEGSEWLFRNGWRRIFRDDGSEVETFERQEADLGVTPGFFASEHTVLLWGVQREPDQMSLGDQRDYIRELSRRGYDTTALRVDLARKLAFPLIPFFMVLLGFPFSFQVGARGSLFGVGLAIGVTVVYWAALAVFNALGTAELLSPTLAAWAPNVIFGGVGLYLTLHVRT
jgi:LPS export ABC transporter permease LptF